MYGRGLEGRWVPHRLVCMPSTPAACLFTSQPIERPTRPMPCVAESTAPPCRRTQCQVPPRATTPPQPPTPRPHPSCTRCPLAGPARLPPSRSPHHQRYLLKDELKASPAQAGAACMAGPGTLPPHCAPIPSSRALHGATLASVAVHARSRSGLCAAPVAVQAALRCWVARGAGAHPPAPTPAEPRCGGAGHTHGPTPHAPPAPPTPRPRASRWRRRCTTHPARVQTLQTHTV